MIKVTEMEKLLDKEIFTHKDIDLFLTGRGKSLLMKFFATLKKNNLLLTDEQLLKLLKKYKNEFAYVAYLNETIDNYTENTLESIFKIYKGIKNPNTAVTRMSALLKAKNISDKLAEEIIDFMITAQKDSKLDRHPEYNKLLLRNVDENEINKLLSTLSAVGKGKLHLEKDKQKEVKEKFKILIQNRHLTKETYLKIWFTLKQRYGKFAYLMDYINRDSYTVFFLNPSTEVIAEEVSKDFSFYDKKVELGITVVLSSPTLTLDYKKSVIDNLTNDLNTLNSVLNYPQGTSRYSDGVIFHLTEFLLNLLNKKPAYEEKITSFMLSYSHRLDTAMRELLFARTMNPLFLDEDAKEFLLF